MSRCKGYRLSRVVRAYSDAEKRFRGALASNRPELIGPAYLAFGVAIDRWHDTMNTPKGRRIIRDAQRRWDRVRGGQEMGEGVGT